jgi:hypothetical protein
VQAQAGARKVYAVEASGMANFAQKLAEGNKSFGKAVQVCRQQSSNDPAASHFYLLEVSSHRSFTPTVNRSRLLSSKPSAINRRGMHFLHFSTLLYLPFSGSL